MATLVVKTLNNFVLIMCLLMIVARVNINIKGKMVRMQVDTRSAKTLLPESL